MSRIAFLTVGITSHVNAYSRSARQLVERGHEVVFISPREEVRDLVEARGFGFHLLEDEQAMLAFTEETPQPGKDLPVFRLLYRTPIVCRLLPYLAWRTRQRQARALYDHITESDELAQLLERLRPDLLLICHELAHHVIRAAALGVPLVLLETHVSTRQAPNVPILDSDFIPTAELDSSRRAAATWKRVYLRRRVRFGLERIYFGGRDLMSALRELAHRTGYDFEREVEFLNQWALLSFPGLPTLFLSAREFDFPLPADDRRDYVGPQVLSNRAEPEDAPADLADCDRLMHDAERQNRQLVYCAMGTWRGNHDARLLRRIASVAADHPEWVLLISLGGNLKPAELGALPRNVHAFQRLSQLRVLKQASAVITHGGIATINECILAGVPMLIYSNGFLDRNGNAARVAYHGLGLRGDARRDRPEKIAADIRRLLDDDAFRDNLGVMAAHFRAYENSDAAVKAIEQYLSLAASRRAD